MIFIGNHVSVSKGYLAMGMHEQKLGKGMIGADALRAVVRHPLLQNRPFILETPNDDKGYQEEIQTVREWMI